MRSGQISSSSANTLTSTAAIDIKDNILFTLGDDADGALVLNSAGLAADAELAGVIVGTSDTLAVAANSLLIANATSNGDIGMYVNDGGHSRMVLWADGSSSDMALMAGSGASVDTYIAGTKEIDYATGAFAFQQATTLSTSTGALTIDGDDGIILQTTGSGSVEVKEILISGTGEGGDGSTPAVGNTFRSSDIVGGTTSNVAGSDLTFSAGLGTGTGDVGTLIFQLPEIVGAGSTIQTRAAVLTMDMVASTTDMSFTFTPNTTVSSSGTLTLGAITLAGAVTGGDQSFTGVGDMTFTNASILASGSTTNDTLLLRANDTTFITLTTAATDVCAMNAITMSGTWLASGTVTMPALTLGGAIAGGDQAFTGVGDMTFTDGSILQTGVAVDDILQIKAYKTDATAARVTLLEFVNDATLPFFTVGAETAYKMKFDPAVSGLYFGDGTDSWDLLIKWASPTTFHFRNSADSAYASCVFDKCLMQTGIEGNTDATYIRPQSANAKYLTFNALITDGATAEVGRLAGAADPYFSMGGSQEHKFYNSGVAELGGEVGFGAAGSLTIATGVIAVTKAYHSIVVENGTGSGADQLDTATGGAEGRILILKPATTGANDQVTVADGTGADTFILAGGANFVMDHVDDRLNCLHNGTEWVETSRSSNS